MNIKHKLFKRHSLSRSFLEVLTASVSATSAGKLFHIFEIRIVKKFLLNIVLQYLVLKEN